MARNLITLQVLTVAGADVTFVAPSGTGTGNGVEVAHSSATPAVVICRNASGSPTTVTVPANGAKTQGVAIPDHTRILSAGDIAYFFLPPAYYADAGKIGLDVSASTDVTFAAIKAPATYA
jgi:hypothetical protein